MKTFDWIIENINNGVICEEYAESLLKAMPSKVRVLREISDINGFAFLCEMSAERGLPYEDMAREFARLINGKYTCERDGFTSEIFLGYNNKGTRLVADKSLYVFLNSDALVYVPPTCRPIILVDANSKLVLNLGNDAVVRLRSWNKDKEAIVNNSDWRSTGIIRVISIN